MRKKYLDLAGKICYALSMLREHVINNILSNSEKSGSLLSKLSEFVKPTNLKRRVGFLISGRIILPNLNTGRILGYSAITAFKNCTLDKIGTCRKADSSLSNQPTLKTDLTPPMCQRNQKGLIGFDGLNKNMRKNGISEGHFSVFA